MEQFETMVLSIHKKNKENTIWKLSDGESYRYLDINIGRGDMDNALIKALNTLGKEGWFLTTQPIYYRLFMQRKIIKGIN